MLQVYTEIVYILFIISQQGRDYKILPPPPSRDIAFPNGLCYTYSA